MPVFGAHFSIAGGVDRAVERARQCGADCLQCFVKSPSQWRFAPLRDDEVARFRTAAQGRDKGTAPFSGRLEKGAVPFFSQKRRNSRSGQQTRHFGRGTCDVGSFDPTYSLRPLVGHASYLLNLAGPDDALYERSRLCLLEEWDRADRLGLDHLVLHPGAHMSTGEAAGLARIALALDWLRAQRPGRKVRILLETTAGAGTVMCGRLEHLRYLIQSCDPPTDGPPEGAPFWLGVAIDTCHLFAAGYDLRTPAAIDDTLGRLDEAVGLSRVCVVHANDAKGDLGSHLDRHEHIGRGRLGREAFRLLVNHPALSGLPFILETPKHDPRGRDMDPVNLRLLRRLARQARP
jgi:deoxyribonuclease-4